MAGAALRTQETSLLTRLLVYYKDILGEMNQQSDGEIKEREREVPNKGASVLTEFGAWHGGTWNCCGIPIWKSLNPVLRVCMAASLDRHI